MVLTGNIFNLFYSLSFFFPQTFSNLLKLLTVGADGTAADNELCLAQPALLT